MGGKGGHKKQVTKKTLLASAASDPASFVDCNRRRQPTGLRAYTSLHAGRFVEVAAFVVYIQFVQIRVEFVYGELRSTSDP